MGSYTPGLDFNLLDARSPNTYVNPDRLGSEEGAGRAFRYGACLYLQLGADGDTLTIERVAADCGLTPAASRAFTSAALQFVR